MDFFHYFVPKTKIKDSFARDNIESRIKKKKLARLKTLKKIDKIEKKIEENEEKKIDGFDDVLHYFTYKCCN